MDADVHLPTGYRVLTGGGLTGGRRPKKDVAYEKAISVGLNHSLIQTNVVKRDRRTIEEIQHDMKRNRTDN